MKDSFMMMVGAALGIGAYMGLNRLSQNRNKIKSKVNSIIDDTANMFE